MNNNNSKIPESTFHVTVCASGGGGNFEALIKGQVAGGYAINLLIVDRKCGAIDKAVQSNIPYLLLDKKNIGSSFFEVMDRAVPLGTNLIVLAGFYPIINDEFCRKWAGRIINTHPSLLPKYGGKGMYGVKVQEAVLANKEPLAGCTVHYVNEQIDGGGIILQKTVTVDPKESAWELGGRIFAEENKLLVEAIKILIQKQRGSDV